MRIIVVGASGTIGRAVVDVLSPGHEVVRVGHRGGDLQVDLGSRESIADLFGTVGRFDAVVSAAGAATFGPLSELTDADYSLALGNKLMGQVNLVRLGLDHISDGGSFTLTSGMLAHHPMPGSAAISMVNAGLEGFVRAAALEMPGATRVNVVSPVFVKETMEAMGMDSSRGMPASQVALAYKETVESDRSGDVVNLVPDR